jgi:hypothetical protein
MTQNTCVSWAADNPERAASASVLDANEHGRSVLDPSEKSSCEKALASVEGLGVGDELGEALPLADPFEGDGDGRGVTTGTDAGATTQYETAVVFEMSPFWTASALACVG